MILAIDIGNSYAKIAAFDESGEINTLQVVPTSALQGEMAGIIKELPEVKAVGWLSTAGTQAIDQYLCWELLEKRPLFFPITSQTQLPIAHRYATPETLGTDRIVASIAACSHQPHKPVLVIDAGTAITYDFVNAQGIYLGGGIAPGIRMRFEALHHFTASLPLVEGVKNTPLIGNSTEASIRSGVLNGALAEVKGIIDQYLNEFGPEVQVFLTGGDRSFFELRLKKLNFASPNLVLEGIYLIVKHNGPL